MKCKLLRKIRSIAKGCAHITSITTENDFTISRKSVSSVSFGYRTSECYKLYSGIYKQGMSVEEYERNVWHRYWLNNRKYYYAKYGRDYKEYD
jgi:hypothetical protein